MKGFNVFDYLETREQDIVFLAGFVESYLETYDVSEIDNIDESFPEKNLKLYVDFDIYMGEIKNIEVAVQCEEHHFDKERESHFLSWIITDDILPRINRRNRDTIKQELEIVEDRQF